MKLTVNLEKDSYPIYIENNILSQAGDYIRKIYHGKRIMIISDDNVFPLYGDRLIHTLDSTYECHHLVLPHGESTKDFQTLPTVYKAMLEAKISRSDLVIALGGGVIGDLVGFAAASYQRGIPFIQIPTTLLSQVDSSVGGKTGVNHPLGKNMIGAFYQPKAVVIDTDCLATLPRRELSAGMAEVIKYGIIWDAEFFSWLESHMDGLMALDSGMLIQAILKCCSIKAEVVSQDETETGVRALLNLGHTFGHAIEAEQGYGNWLHGEAVSAGILLAAQTSFRLGLLVQEQVARIRALLAAAQLPLVAPASMDYPAFIKHMMRDKKVLSGKLRLVLPTDIGRADVFADVTEQLLLTVIDADHRA